MTDTNDDFVSLDRNALIEVLAARLQEKYVFPEVAVEIGRHLRQKRDGGAYGTAEDPAALAALLTTDVQEISKDKHMIVRWNAAGPPATENEEPSPEMIALWQENGRLQNWGFSRVERLPGNIGYVEIKAFYPAYYGGDAAVRAMNMVAETGALIFDVRPRGGGDPAMIQLVTSYLFGLDPVHLNSMYWRATDSTQQWWTMSYVPGPRYGREKPVYVLTSSETFSGSEEFSYNLKQLKRATLIGETTGGGAHPGFFHPLAGRFEVFVPVGRAINPISGTNWEGTGVEPDISVPAEAAFDLAYERALQDVLDALPAPGSLPQGLVRGEAEEALAKLRSAAQISAAT